MSRLPGGRRAQTSSSEVVVTVYSPSIVQNEVIEEHPKKIDKIVWRTSKVMVIYWLTSRFEQFARRHSGSLKLGHRTPWSGFSRLRREKILFWTSGAPEPQLGPRPQPGLVGPCKNWPFFLRLGPSQPHAGSCHRPRQYSAAPPHHSPHLCCSSPPVLCCSSRRWCSPARPPRWWWSPAPTSSSARARELRGPRPE